MALWEGIIPGFEIAIPVGAIAVLIIEGAVRRGFLPGFAAGAGAEFDRFFWVQYCPWFRYSCFGEVIHEYFRFTPYQPYL